MKRIEQVVLGPIYALAIGLRQIAWGIRRPARVGVRALIVRDNAVLLVRHRAGWQRWALPGGSVARYERLAEAARREAEEETGAAVRIERLLGIYDSFHDGVSNYVAVFVGTTRDNPHPPRSLEITEARFFPIAALPTDLNQGSGRRVEEYLAGEYGLAKLW